MDPKLVQQVLDVKLHNRYPVGSTSKEKSVIKRRADTYMIKGKDACHIGFKTQWSSPLVKLTVNLMTFKPQMESCTTSAGANEIKMSTWQRSFALQRRPAASLKNSTPASWVDAVEKTHSSIIHRYYWPGMEDDIHKWVSCYLYNEVEHTFRFKSNHRSVMCVLETCWHCMCKAYYNFSI